MKAWEGRMVGYGNYFKTYRIWESGTKIVESQNVTFIETLPGKLNTLDCDHHDSDGDTFLDVESSSISLGTQEERPEAEEDAQPDTDLSQTDVSQNVGTSSDSDEESGSDVNSQPFAAAKAKIIARTPTEAIRRLQRGT